MAELTSLSSLCGVVKSDLETTRQLLSEWKSSMADSYRDIQQCLAKSAQEIKESCARILERLQEFDAIDSTDDALSILKSANAALTNSEKLVTPKSNEKGLFTEGSQPPVKMEGNQMLVQIGPCSTSLLSNASLMAEQITEKNVCTEGMIERYMRKTILATTQNWDSSITKLLPPSIDSLWVVTIPIERPPWEPPDWYIFWESTLSVVDRRVFDEMRLRNRVPKTNNNRASQKCYVSLIMYPSISTWYFPQHVTVSLYLTSTCTFELLNTWDIILVVLVIIQSTSYAVLNIFLRSQLYIYYLPYSSNVVKKFRAMLLNHTQTRYVADNVFAQKPSTCLFFFSGLANVAHKLFVMGRAWVVARWKGLILDYIGIIQMESTWVSTNSIMLVLVLASCSKLKDFGWACGKVIDIGINQLVLVFGGGFEAWCWCWYQRLAIQEKDGYKVATIDFTCYGVYSIVTNNITSLSHYLEPLSAFFEKPWEWKTVILLVHELVRVYAMRLFPLHISKVVAVAIVSMWSVSSAPVWKKMIVVIVVRASLGAEFLCYSSQHYCEFICGELLHEFILATVIRACMHLGGVNQAVANLIDFAPLGFTTLALHRSLDSLLDVTHPSYSCIGKLDLTRNVAARELIGIYFHSTHFHVIAYVGLHAIVEKSLTIHVASSPRVNFVCLVQKQMNKIKCSSSTSLWGIHDQIYVVMCGTFPGCAQWDPGGSFPITWDGSLVLKANCYMQLGGLNLTFVSLIALASYLYFLNLNLASQVHSLVLFGE